MILLLDSLQTVAGVKIDFGLWCRAGETAISESGALRQIGLRSCRPYLKDPIGAVERLRMARGVGHGRRFRAASRVPINHSSELDGDAFNRARPWASALRKNSSPGLREP